MTRVLRLPRVLSVVNFKGGCAKSTTAAYLAHALRALSRDRDGRLRAGGTGRRLRVCCVDADPLHSLLDWASLGEWDIPVLGLPVPTVHRQLWGVIDQDVTDVVVIDTPPLEERAGIVRSVLEISTDVLVPLAPTMMELHRLHPVWPAIDDSAATRDRDASVSVLLNRTRPNANSTGTVRDTLTGQGRRVLSATVPLLERYAQAFGEPVDDEDAPYAAVAAELTQEW